MKTFKDYYRFPLKPMVGLESVKVLTVDNKMAFDWMDKFPRETIDRLIAVINGERENDTIDSFYYNDRDCCVYFDRHTGPKCKLLLIRGWGMLIGNPHHLSADEAVRVQNEFGEYICKRLNT